MQIEKVFFYHCNVFEYNQNSVKFFCESDDALLVFVVLDIDIYLYDIYSFLPSLSSSFSSQTVFSSTNFSKDSIYITISRTLYISSCIPSEFLSCSFKITSSKSDSVVHILLDGIVS